MNPFYKMIRNLIAEENTSGHFSFKIADPTAVGENPVRELSLDVVPVNETSSIISLAWKDSAEKILEKTTSTEEANHLAELISTDLAQVVKLTSEDNYAEAKKVMGNILKTYLETTDTPVSTNMPKLHNTQASVGKQADPEIAFERAIDRLDSKLMKGLIHQEEYDAEYAKLKKEMFPKKSSQDDKLWRQAKISLTNTFPSGTKQEITFESAEELNAYEGKKNGKTDQDHIPLWDAQKGKGPAKGDGLSPASLSYEDIENEKERDHEDMQKHIDETIKNKLESAMQEKAASVFGPADIELVKSLRAPGIGRNWDEIKKIFIKDLNRDKDATTIFLDEQRQSLDPAGIEVEPVKEEKSPLTPPEELVSPDTHEKLLKDHEDKKKDNHLPVKEKSDTFTPKDIMDIPEDTEIQDESSLDNEIARADNSDIHKVAAGDLNPLQEPLQEKPTTPSQDTIPFDQSPDHRAPKPESWVIVKTDLKGELPSFRGKFISEKTENDGSKWGIVDKDGELLQVEMNRIIPESEGSSGAQDVEPVAEPIIEMPKDDEIQVTPKMDDFHASSQKEFLTIKAEAEALLQEIDGMGKTSYKFIKKGLEKHASDSAFEGNGWCRVWVTDDEVAADAKYAEALKIPDETARIEALKEIARNIAHEALRLADDSGAKVGVQSWFDSLSPSDHDRIDWVALANPKSSEDEDLEFEREQMSKYGPDAVNPDFKDQVNPKSSLEPKVEKKAADGSACIKCHKVLPLDQMVGNEHGAGYLCKADAPAWNKEASDFEKGISQNKTADGKHKCPDCSFSTDDQGELSGHHFRMHNPVTKTADEPEVAPKTQFKDYKIKPKYVPGTEAVPATPEMDEVLSKMEVLEQNLATLEAARKQIQAKMKEELAKIDQTGDRVGMEAELQASIEKAGILISAVESKVVSWKDKLYTMQTEEISYVPSVTPKEMLEKIYAKFSGAEAFVSSVLNGMLSQAKKVMENTLIRWPNKKSSVNKEASILDDMNHYNDELMAALRELSTPL